MIEYFPSTIPRILINRTVVHPSTRSPDDPDGEPDFRQDYVFDAYLLGFCDDVTRDLAKRLFNSEEEQSKSKRKTKTNQTDGRLLAKILKGEDEDYGPDDWNSLTVPPDRVLLFPGAQTSHEDSNDLAYLEIAHCDGCSKRIMGTIQKCTVCFDYDLCKNCFPKLSKTHFDGNHTFGCEKVSPN